MKLSITKTSVLLTVLFYFLAGSITHAEDLDYKSWKKMDKTQKILMIDSLQTGFMFANQFSKTINSQACEELKKRENVDVDKCFAYNELFGGLLNKANTNLQKISSEDLIKKIDAYYLSQKENQNKLFDEVFGYVLSSQLFSE